MARKLKLDAIMQLPMSRKLLILVVIHISFIVLFYLFVYSPKNVEMTSLETNLESIRKRVSSTRVIAANIPKFKKEKEKLEAQLKKALTQLPNKKEIPNLINNISKAGRESGLDILVFKPMGEKSKNFYAEVPVNMKVNGGFESFYIFCQKVGGMSRIVNINGLDLSSKRDEQGNVMLTANFMATTFRFIAEAKTKAIKRKKRGK